MLNVFFENNMASIVEDKQMYTLRDMFIYIGSNLCLFLGMSFMSLNETWYFISYTVYQIVKWRQLGKTVNLKLGNLCRSIKNVCGELRQNFKLRSSKKITVNRVIKVQPLVHATRV